MAEAWKRDAPSLEKFGKNAASAASGIAEAAFSAAVNKTGEAMKKVIAGISDRDWKKVMKDMGKMAMSKNAGDALCNVIEKAECLALAAKAEDTSTEMAKKTAKSFGGLGKMTKAAFEDAGNLVKFFNTSEMGQITNETFKATAETFGKVSS